MASQVFFIDFEPAWNRSSGKSNCWRKPRNQESGEEKRLDRPLSCTSGTRQYRLHSATAGSSPHRSHRGSRRQAIRNGCEHPLCRHPGKRRGPLAHRHAQWFYLHGAGSPPRHRRRHRRTRRGCRAGRPETLPGGPYRFGHRTSRHTRVGCSLQNCTRCRALGNDQKISAMGGASRKGKMAQHSELSPQLTVEKCIGCGTCRTSALTTPYAWSTGRKMPTPNDEARKLVHIDPGKCVGCAGCIHACPQGALGINWKRICSGSWSAWWNTRQGTQGKGETQPLHEFPHPDLTCLRLLSLCRRPIVPTSDIGFPGPDRH